MSTAPAATEELELARSMDAALAQLLSVPRLLAAAAADAPLSPAVQESLLALGWAGIAVPEAHGGLELPWHLAARLAAVAGRRLLPAAARGETFVLAPALAALADGGDAGAADRLSGLLEGRLRGGAATLEPGTDHGVAYLPPEAELVAVVSGARLAVLAVAGDAVQITPLAGLDPGQGACRVTVDLDRPAIPALADEAAEQIRRGWQLATLCEAFGAAQRCLELSTAYAAEREQFGVKIVSFQAVSHHLAQMAVSLEASEAGLGRLVASLAAGPGDQGLLRALCHWVPAAARSVCEGAIQVHGGAGFSWELGLHLHYRRVLVIQTALGGGSGSARRAGSEYLRSLGDDNA
jgi:alkylation response protein AidB-like acyl-CoA dehydrogenase